MAPAAPPTEEAAEPEPDDPVTESTDSVVRAAESRRDVERTEVPAAPTETKPGHLVVHGKVIGVEQDGTERTDASGSIAVTVWGEDFGTVQKVTIEDGSFVTQLPIDQEISISHATLDGRNATSEDEQKRFQVQAEMTFRVLWGGVTTLHVVDARSGTELDSVTITSAEWDHNDLEHPASDEKVRVDGQPSPIALTPVEAHGWITWQETIRVGAAGYAWQTLAIDHKKPTPRTIRLEPGGGLKVQITGSFTTSWAGQDDFVLRLRRGDNITAAEQRLNDALEQLKTTDASEFPGGKKPTEAELRAEFARFSLEKGQPVVEVPARTGDPIELRGLKPGTYAVTVERGEWWRSPAELGATRAEVVAGTTTFASLVAEPVTEQTKVLLSGTIFVPPSWEQEWFTLHFEPVDLVGKTDRDEPSVQRSAMRPDPARPGLFHWDAGPVAPGRIEIQCYAFETQWVVDTGPEGRNDVALEVGEPIEAVIHVVEDTTGRPVDDKVQVLWNVVRPEGVMGGSLGHAERDEQTGEIRIRAPAGPIDIMVHDRRFSSTGLTRCELSPNNREFTVRVRRDCGVNLTLQHAGNTIPWAPRSTVWPRITDAKTGRAAGRGSGSGEGEAFYLKVRDPGVYLVEIPDQPGFAPVEPFEVVIPDGEFIDHVVELQLP